MTITWLKTGSYIIAPIISITAVTLKSGIIIREIIENTTQTIGIASRDWGDPWSFGLWVLSVSGDWLQTKAIVNYSLPGDDQSDPNCLMVYRYYTELKMASKLTWRLKR